MSRDQRPGKLKLVGATAPAKGRRREDREPQDGRKSTASAADPAAGEPRKSPGLVLPLLFIVAAAVGGACFTLAGPAS